MSSGERVSQAMLLVRVPRRTRDEFVELAVREGKNRSSLLRDLIAAALGRDDTPRRPPPPTALAA